MAKTIVFFILFFVANLFPQNSENKIIISEDLELVWLTGNAFIHISYMTNEKYGKFPCNGVIYFNNSEAVVLDTPPDDSITVQLIKWWEESYPEIKITAVIVNHFHVDCLGGLNEFHKKNIPSYSYKTTPDLAAGINLPEPQITFADSMMLKIGNEDIICRYFGEGHSSDNIVVYIPSEKILFGGCLIKSLSSGKGNLEDANVAEWSNTVEKVKKEYENARFIIPGHGNTGGIELLDYTIKMFR